MSYLIRLLYIEDDDVDRMAFERLVRKTSLPYTYRVASSLREGLELLRNERFDVIVADYNLGDGNALEVLVERRDIPLIVVTGAGDEEIAVRAMKAGAHDYLVKDVERRYLQVLPMTVEHAVDAHRTHRLVRLLSHAMRNIGDSVFIVDHEMKIVFVNHAFGETYGYDTDDILGKSAKLLLPRLSDFEFLPLQTAESAEVPVHFETEHRHSDGHLFPVAVTHSELRLDEGIGGGVESLVVVVSRDITQRKAAERQLEFQAYHDSLTHLPNRTSLRRALEVAIRRMHDEGARFAVIFIDLDRFKLVNDSLGHLAGDELLVGIAERLRALVRPADLVARLGGDEFCILLEGIQHVGEATAFTERLLGGMHKPFTVVGQEVYSSASIGVALGTPEYATVDEFLRDADTAMYEAKRLGRARYVTFDGEVKAAATRRLRLETELWHAFDRREFQVVYQPLVSLTDGRIVAMEALLRWEKGGVAPHEFLPVAEETGLSVPLGEWVLREACQQLRTWIDAGHVGMRLMVNLSGRHVNPVLPPHVLSLLRELAIDPELLTLEITESSLRRDFDAVLPALRQLRASGVGVALDDYGTDESSLSVLRLLPLSTVKFDPRLVRRGTDGATGAAMLRACTQMAKALGLEVVAEGVESREEQRLLQQEGCDLMQGFHFCPPIGAAEAAAMLATGKRAPGERRRRGEAREVSSPSS